jgi:hypothetical protein
VPAADRASAAPVHHDSWVEWREVKANSGCFIAPKGLKNLAQGFNQVSTLGTIKQGRFALTRKMVELRVTVTSVNQRVSPAPTGPNVFVCLPRLKPGLSFLGPPGRQRAR